MTDKQDKAEAKAAAAEQKKQDAADAKAANTKADPVLNAGDKQEDQTDPVEESKETGTATTDDGRTVTLSPGAVPENAPDVGDAEDPNVNRELTFDECKEILGDLRAGGPGWLPLDKDGYIIGAARKGEPGPDDYFARVIVSHTDIGPKITTPSGASITRKMNPEQRKASEHNKHFEEAAAGLAGEEDNGSR